MEPLTAATHRWVMHGSRRVVPPQPSPGEPSAGLGAQRLVSRRLRVDRDVRVLARIQHVADGARPARDRDHALRRGVRAGPRRVHPSPSRRVRDSANSVRSTGSPTRIGSITSTTLPRTGCSHRWSPPNCASGPQPPTATRSRSRPRRPRADAGRSARIAWWIVGAALLDSGRSQRDKAIAYRPPSSSGLGHHPFKVAARVRIPLGVRRESVICHTYGPVVKSGVHAGLSSRRSRVQVPSGPQQGATRHRKMTGGFSV